MMKNMQMDGPNAYVCNEMTGISDKFAYTDTDMAQIKSFSYGTEDPIYTGPVEEEKITSTEQNKLLQDIQINRDGQKQEYQTMMKKGQLQAIIKSEHNLLNSN